MKKVTAYFSIVLITSSCLKTAPVINTYTFNKTSNTYDGSREISDPIYLSDQDNMVIDSKTITNPHGHCIKLSNCHNVKITNCWLGPALNQAIDLSNCTNVIINGNRFESVSTGVYALRSSGITVINNEAKNMTGPLPRGQMVQFDKVWGEGNKINYNKCLNILGQSYAEDVISVYKSNGTSSDPIQVIGNMIKGGGPSTTGGGIMAGDGGSSSYIIVKDNKLVDPGQYGIAISGGTHISITDNQVYGKQQSFTNVGVYVWNQHAYACSDNVVMNNKINWTNKNGRINNCWNAGNCGTVTGWSSNLYANIDSTILPHQLLSFY